jgi:hypothetical protein
LHTSFQHLYDDIQGYDHGILRENGYESGYDHGSSGKPTVIPWSRLAIMDQIAVDNFCAYLRIKTVQPEPDYAGSTQFLTNV